MLTKLSTASVCVLSLLILKIAAAPQGSTPQSTTAPTGPAPTGSPTNGNGLCTTPACVEAAQTILSNMNPKADPCVDFYQFACGGFDAREKIPDDDVMVSAFEQTQKRSDAVVQKILEADPKSLRGPNGKRLDPVSLSLLKKSQALYKSCMNETQLSAIGHQPLFRELQQVISTVYPIPGSQLASVFPPNKNPGKPRGTNRARLSVALAHFVRSGVDTFLSFTVGEDPSNTMTQGVSLEEGGLTLPARELYSDESITTQLQDLIQQMMTASFAPPSSSGQTGPANATAIDFGTMAQEIVAFETALAKIATDPQELFDSSRNIHPRNLGQLDRLNPAVDWSLFLEQTLQTRALHRQNITVRSPAYVEHLGRLLQQTQPSTLQHYLAWKLIFRRGQHLSSEFRRPLEMLQATLSGVNPEIPPSRSQTCLEAANNGLGAILGHFYIAQAFPATSKQLGEDIVEALRQSYLHDLENNLDWLDPPTRAHAIAKVKKMGSHVGYSTFSPDVRSPRSISSYYSQLAIQASDFYGNQGRVARWTVGRLLSQAGKKTERRTMQSDPQVVDALFTHTRNEMVFPAGILQRPFFVEANPEYLNFGGMGVVAGHELTHGLDSNGRTYDENGTHVDWWTNSTATQFLAKAQCFKDQYAQFSVPNPVPGGTPIPVNGQLTLSENLADNGGVQKSYTTWHARWVSDPEGQRFNNRPLSGLENYTREQLFFVAYGQLWCAKVRPEALVQYVRTDAHSPPVARVNGAMQNSAAFAAAFGCAATAPMNPANKCVIW